MSAPMIITPEQLHILQHSLGVDRHGRGSQYRNHFCTGPSTTDWKDCEALTAAGLMTKHTPREISGGDFIFTVTDAGKQLMAAQSPRPPKLTRSQQRYRDWKSDDGSESFGEWLLRKEHNRKHARMDE